MDNVCACQKCKRMCQLSPCMGTPEDIEKLLNAGHADKLAITAWGNPGNTYVVIMPRKKTNEAVITNMVGECVFYEKGKCLLHADGLKPKEGRISNHRTSHNGLKVRNVVAVEWKKPEAEKLIDKFIESQPHLKQWILANC